MTLDGHICLSDSNCGEICISPAARTGPAQESRFGSLQFRTLQAKHDGVSFPFVGMFFWQRHGVLVIMAPDTLRGQLWRVFGEVVMFASA